MAKSSVGKTDFKNLSSATSTSKKIESPMAKYNSIGQLTCIICNQVVKSELVWNAHLNSKQHIQNKQKLKSQIMGGGPETNNSSSKKNEPATDKGFKRPLPVSSNQASSSPNQDKSQEDGSLNTKKQKLDNLIKKTDSIDLNKKQSSAVNNSNNTNNNIKKVDDVVKSTVVEVQVNNTNATTSAVATSLPEGFFDDPDMDDKIRGVSREANLEAEYEEFKKIIQAEEHKSDLIVEQDDALRDIVRDLEQVDDLINRWSKIETLHQKREALLAANKIKKNNNSNNINEQESMDHDHQDEEQNNKSKTNKKNDEDSDDDEDLENLDSVLGLTLRSKNRC